MDFTWVGIDGAGSNDVLQAGVEADALCYYSYGYPVTSTYYSAWFEWYWAGCNCYPEQRISNFPGLPCGRDIRGSKG
jgi:hypothetical protein